MSTKINTVKIDVESKHVKTFMAALRRLVSTHSLDDNGEYMFPGNTDYNLLTYTGEMDADGIDAWAYRVKAGAGFIGAVTVNPGQSEEASTGVQFSSKKNDKGAPIAANPKTAHVYAELDYFGMAKARDTRSRNRREGKYVGVVSGYATPDGGKPKHVRRGNSQAPFSAIHASRSLVAAAINIARVYQRKKDH